MRKFWTEFKKFISKGNIVDLAVAVIIGGAFNKIVSSLVNDVIMPLISLVVGGADVTDWKWVIKPMVTDANGNVTVAESALRYGSFLQTIIDFLIIALTIFIIVKVFTASRNRLEKLGQTVTETFKKDDQTKTIDLPTDNQTVAVATENIATQTTTQDSELIELTREIRDLLSNKKGKKK